MKRSAWIPAGFIALAALFLAPLTQSSFAAQRYRSYGYRSSHYRHRPAYRGYSYRYRPYYRHGYRPYSRAYWGSYYSYWPSFHYSWGYPAPYAHVRYSYYGGGAVDYSYAHGSIRPKVEPKQTEVYVDGYYAGIVDDFDGVFQKLYMPPGQHEILLRLDGYKTHQQNLNVNSGATVKLHHEMKPLDPGEKTPPPPNPPAEDAGLEEKETPPQPPPDRNQAPPTTREDLGRPAEPSPTPVQEQAPRQVRTARPPGRFGLLALQVQPTDAQVFIDGELWGSLGGLKGLSIHLSAGRHRLEVRKDGFTSFASDVDILQGETTQLNVKLDGIEL